jgi:hypothetical protein
MVNSLNIDNILFKIDNKLPYFLVNNYSTLSESKPSMFYISKKEKYLTRTKYSNDVNDNIIYDAGNSLINLNKITNDFKLIKDIQNTAFINFDCNYNKENICSKPSVEIIKCNFYKYKEEMINKNDIAFKRSFSYSKINEEDIILTKKDKVKITCNKCNFTFIREIRKHCEGLNCKECAKKNRG